MLWMVANAIDQLVRFQFARANVMDGCEQWESGKDENRARAFLIPFIQYDPRSIRKYGSIYFSSICLFLSIKLTSSAVIGPCNF